MESIQNYYDSICSEYGAPNPGKARVVRDVDSIDESVLMENINWAFKMRDSTSWGKSVPFDIFCEYILPYRVSKEKYEIWRPHFYEMMQPIRDTTIARNYWDYARTINKLMNYHVKTIHLFWAYPFDIPLSLQEKARLGACIHQVQYTTLLMRANGIPVGIDYVTRWANRSAGHHWCALIMPDGSSTPFDPGKKKLEMEYDVDRVVAKVFRRTFEPNFKELPIPISTEIPPAFYNFQQKDVTDKYKRTANVSIPVFKKERKYSYAVICTFDNSNWSPIYFGKVSKGKALFKNMGCGVVYQAKFYDNGWYIEASDPFLLDSLGQVKFYNVDENNVGAITLKRKYPLTRFMQYFAGKVVGSKMQGANKCDFSDSSTLFTINKLPEIFEEVQVDDTCKYKYVRYYANRYMGEQASEVEFYGLANNGKDTVKLEGEILGCPKNSSYEKLFDGKLLTYFRASSSEKWGGLCVRFCLSNCKNSLCGA